jgi:uncharacterized membrane protein (UPF0127 family)
MGSVIFIFLGVILNFFSLSSFGQAPVTFESKVITVGKVKLTVEVAETPEQHERGLMFRHSLNKNSGMLFIFSEKRILNFWMKNTFIPLSIGFFDEQGILFQILDMDPVKSELQKNIPTYSSARPAKFALEVNKGWFIINKIKVGDKIHYPGL